MSNGVVRNRHLPRIMAPQHNIRNFFGISNGRISPVHFDGMVHRNP
jgi:hypothetical protein